MADPQPASRWAWERPGTGTPIRSVEVRENLDALGVLLRTDDEDLPIIKRDGMPRFNVSDPNNVRFQIWQDNGWRTLVQKIQLGIPAPAKLESRFDVATLVWTIDHNLGSRPHLQVYDIAGNLLQLVTLSPPQRDQIVMTRVSPAILTTLPAGPTVLASWVATFRGAVDELVLSVEEAITGAPDFTFDVAINGTPTTGGSVVVNAVQALGARLGGGAPSALNTFEVGDTVTVRATAVTPPTGGAVLAYMDVERRLQTGHYIAAHATENRVVITHPAARTGFALLIG